MAQPFLTEAQRAALDAALAAKAAEQKAAQLATYKASGQDRKPRHGKGLGGAKKGGAGGKYTWGGLLTEGDGSETVLDRNDPNYDSEEEKNIVFQEQQSRIKSEVASYKQEVTKICLEYFSAGDVANVAESLDELGASVYTHYFVKRLVTLALDRHDREREMACVLLSSLYTEVLPPEQVQKGFLALINALPDTILDVPDAVDKLALFIARAVIDDILPPAIIQNIPKGSSGGAATACLDALRVKVEAHLGARHAAEKILRCWGSGAGLNYQDTKDSITKILAEFMDSHDADEAARCLRALGVPFFHHELVKQGLAKALEAPHQGPALVALLQRLSSSNEVSGNQLAKGFQRVADQLEDMALDNPAAKENYASVLKLAREAGLVDESASQGIYAKDPSTWSISSSTVNGGAAPGAGGHSVAEFKFAAGMSVREYFDSQDAQEVARRLVELDEPGLMHIFVKQAVVLACDRHDRERELVSNLLVALTPKVINSDQMAQGFTRLLAAVDDMVLDCPDAVHLITLFLGRAIVDEVLPPSYLADVVPQLQADGLGVNVVKASGTVLSARHGAERLTNCWHGGALSLDQIREAIAGMLKEYCVGQQVSEAMTCLKDLNVPYYHHEVVKRALEVGFEEPALVEPLLKLLAALASSGDVSDTQMTKGFERVKAVLDDEVIDYGAKAKATFREMVAKATSEGWLVMDPEA